MQLQVLPDNDTSVIRGPVIKKTGWPKGQWSGANPTPDCFPFSGVPGANMALLVSLALNVLSGNRSE